MQTQSSTTSCFFATPRSHGALRANEGRRTISLASRGQRTGLCSRGVDPLPACGVSYPPCGTLNLAATVVRGKRRYDVDREGDDKRPAIGLLDGHHVADRSRSGRGRDREL